SDPDSRWLFLRGLRTEDETVFVAGSVDFDLSGLQEFPVAGNVKVIGLADSGHPGGPRLFTTSRPRPMLGIRSERVSISGIRFDGQESTDPCAEANQPDVDAIDVYASQNVEIDHNEFYAWNGSTVGVHDDDRDRVNRDNSRSVWIHDNYMHDNQH